MPVTSLGCPQRSARYRSELQDGAVVAGHVSSDGRCAGVDGSLQAVVFDGAVGGVVPCRFETESAMLVGDFVDSAVLFDPAGRSFPLEPSRRVSRHGTESLREVAERIDGDALAAGDGVVFERVFQTGELAGGVGVVVRPAVFATEARFPVADGALEPFEVAIEAGELAVELLCGGFEGGAFFAVPDAAEHGLLAAGGDESAGGVATTVEHVRELSLIDKLRPFEPHEVLVMSVGIEGPELGLFGVHRS